MRILHLNDHLAARGGIETYLLSVIPHLEAEGIESNVLFADGDMALVSRAEQVSSLSSPRIRDRQTAYDTVEAIIRRYSPQVVHLHNIQNVGAISACLNAVPTIFTAHDYRYFCPSSSFYFRGTKEICSRTCGLGCFVATATKHCMSPHPTRGWRQYSRVKWMQRNLSRFRRALAPSEGAARRLVASGMARSQIQVLPYFCPVEPLLEPRKLPDRPTLLYIGRVSDNKGWRYFVEALGLLPPTVQGRFVGNLTAATEANVRECARANGCAERLTLHPWAGRREILDHYRQASVMVFPSIWDETLGIVGLEALACGVPVVSTDVGGVREWLIPGQTGYLVPPKDGAAIADAVQQLLDSPAMNRQMGNQGQALVHEKFSIAGHVDALCEEYRAAVSGGQPTSHPVA